MSPVLWRAAEENITLLVERVAQYPAPPTPLDNGDYRDRPGGAQRPQPAPEPRPAPAPPAPTPRPGQSAAA